MPRTSLQLSLMSRRKLGIYPIPTKSWFGVAERVFDSSLPLYTQVDDAPTCDTSDFIYTDETSSATLQLSAVDDPGVSTGHALTYKARSDSGGDLTVTLQQPPQTHIFSLGENKVIARPPSLLKVIPQLAKSQVFAFGHPFPPYSPIGFPLVASTISGAEILGGAMVADAASDNVAIPVSAIPYNETRAILFSVTPTTLISYTRYLLCEFVGSSQFLSLRNGDSATHMTWGDNGQLYSSATMLSENTPYKVMLVIGAGTSNGATAPWEFWLNGLKVASGTAAAYSFGSSLRLGGTSTAAGMKLGLFALLRGPGLFAMAKQLTINPWQLLKPATGVPYSVQKIIATRTHTNVPTDWTDYTMTLTSGEADLITDYSNLFVKLDGTP